MTGDLTPADYLSLLKVQDSLFVDCDVVAKVIGCNAESLRLAAQTAPERLGFPVCVMGARVRIPRKPFIKYVEG